MITWFPTVFLCYCIAGINPIGINIDGSREISKIESISNGCALLGGEKVLTVDGALELLIADLARELADAGFLVELDSDGFLVVTEEAREHRGERFVLGRTRLDVKLVRRKGAFPTHFLLALGLLSGLLSFTLYDGWLVL